MYRCQHLIPLSKQFWNWFCRIAFRAAVVLKISTEDFDMRKMCAKMVSKNPIEEQRKAKKSQSLLR